MPKTSDPQPDSPMLLTIPEAARLLAIGRTTLYSLIDRGELRAVAIGRARRIPRSALQEFVEARTRAA